MCVDNLVCLQTKREGHIFLFICTIIIHLLVFVSQLLKSFENIIIKFGCVLLRQMKGYTDFCPLTSLGFESFIDYMPFYVVDGCFKVIELVVKLICMEKVRGEEE